MNQNPTRTTADKLLDTLMQVGIDYVFANLGTDHVPIVEALARRQQEERRSPQFILCPHENIAIHMALGYAGATGRGQAVMDLALWGSLLFMFNDLDIYNDSICCSFSLVLIVSVLIMYSFRAIDGVNRISGATSFVPWHVVF